MGRIFSNAVLSLPLIGAFAMFAVGIVVMYRASRVLNLAHGAMAALPAYLVYAMTNAGLPIAAAVPLGIASGAALGVVVHRAVLQPLAGTSATTKTVGTVAVLGLLVALMAKIWGTAPLRAPAVFPEHTYDVGRAVLQLGEVGLALVAGAAAIALTLLLGRTDLGMVMRGTAENPRAAALMGADPVAVTSLAWALGGGLAATAGILLAATTNLQPFTLSQQVLPAFVAALIGGLGSVGGAIGGAAVVGLALGIVPGLGAWGEQAGSAQVVLAVIALVAMAARGTRFGGTDEDARDRGAQVLRGRRVPALAWLAAVPMVAIWPWLPLPDSIRGDANLAAIYVVVAVSLVLLTGWVGQISLAHASFVGIGAFLTGLLVREAGVPFPLNLPIAAAVAAGAAGALGMVALRVRGLYLAVATLIFGWMTDAYLFKAPWLVGAGGSSTIGDTVVGRPGAVPSFDLSDRRIFWYVAAAAAAAALAVAANLRDSRTGRAFTTVRGSEIAAASLGIDVTRTKLFAFALSGALAGVAGNLIMIEQRTAVADQFSFTTSLFFLSVAVVGNLRLGGVVAASALFAGLTEVFFRIEALGGYLDVVSSGLLLAVTLGSAPAVRARLRRGRERAASAVPDVIDLTAGAPLVERAGPAHADARAPAHARTPAPDRMPAQGEARAPDAPVLVVRGATVRFGGLTALAGLDLDVRPGEIVGLIGPNGAGKTTAFNAISGLAELAEGSIELFGSDVTALPTHARAARGLGRTFQIPQLLPEATVFDNLLVGTHLHATAGPLSHLLVTERAVAEEREARARVIDALAVTGLSEISDARVGDLPFGVLRLVEIARAWLTDARLLLLDEPASGLDDLETARLGALLRHLRGDGTRSILLVEHDVAFVTGLSDRLTVLDRGRVIAAGTPEVVRADPAVIAAYLGTGPGASEPATPAPASAI